MSSKAEYIANRRRAAETLERIYGTDVDTSEEKIAWNEASYALDWKYNEKPRMPMIKDGIVYTPYDIMVAWEELDAS